jgi:hypothetical protein
MRSRERRTARKLADGVCRASGKASYTDRRRANAAARLHGMFNSTAQYPYACRECGRWHLTTSKQE